MSILPENEHQQPHSPSLFRPSSPASSSPHPPSISEENWDTGRSAQLPHVRRLGLRSDATIIEVAWEKRTELKEIPDPATIDTTSRHPISTTSSDPSAPFCLSSPPSPKRQKKESKIGVTTSTDTMQGPRFPSHSGNSIELPQVIPPKTFTAVLPSTGSQAEEDIAYDVEKNPRKRRATDTERRSNPYKTEYDTSVAMKGDQEKSNGAAGEEEGGGGSGGGTTGSSLRDGWEKSKNSLIRHGSFVGPGIIASVAYIDPGNWATDLQAGSAYGYSHLFIVLLSGMIALLFQILATRLGCATGEDLATHCRIALYDRPNTSRRVKLGYRWGLLYPLYALAELGIIFTDLAELLGSAIAINLIIPKIPLWACVVLTSTDVFLVLLLFNQYPARMVTRSMRLFEMLIGILVLTVLGSFVALLVKVSPVWSGVFKGYVPGSGIVKEGGLYIAVGIIGATVMPHAFFIGSKMATMHRLDPSQYEDADEVDEPDTNSSPNSPEKLKSSGANSRKAAGHRASWVAASSSRGPTLHLPQPMSLGEFNLGADRSPRSPASPFLAAERLQPRDEIRNTTTPPSAANPAAAFPASATSSSPNTSNENSKSKRLTPSSPPVPPPTSPPPKTRQSFKPSLACVKAHLPHAQADVAGSLMGFAILINSSILILAAAVFYYGEGKSTTSNGVSDLFDAYDLVKAYIGPAFAYLFAVALFAAGQSASLTVTLSGQIVSEGFIEWHTTPWKRRLITRLIGIVPSLAVAVAVGREGIDTLLVGSQVALSVVLTFVIIPLIIFTSQDHIMAVAIDPRTAALDRVKEVAIAAACLANAALSTSSRNSVEGDVSHSMTGIQSRGNDLPKSLHVVVPEPSIPELTPMYLFKRRSLREMGRFLNPFRRRIAPDGYVSYSNGVFVIYLSCALWLLITIANINAFIALGRGSS